MSFIFGRSKEPSPPPPPPVIEDTNEKVARERQKMARRSGFFQTILNRGRQTAPVGQQSATVG